QALELVAPRINPRQRLPAALIAKLGRLRPDHLAHDPSRYPKLAANRLDRLVLGAIRPTDLCDRLHYQHPLPGPRIPNGSHCGPTVPGVPIGCRSPPKRGPYSTPIHTRVPNHAPDPSGNRDPATPARAGRAFRIDVRSTARLCFAQ